MRFFLAFMLVCGGAFAQTTPGFITGQTPTAALWNSYFGAKADTNNGTLNSATLIAPTFSGGLTVDALTVTAGGALAGTFSGAPTLSGVPTFSGTPVFSTGAAMSGTFSGAHTYSGALTLSAASTALTVTNNASLGGTLTTGTGVTNGLLMSAATLSVTGTGNPAMVIKGLGTGGINFQSGATPFTGLQLTDGGASAVNFLRVQPGTTSNGVSITAVGDAAAVINFKAGTSGNGGSIHSFIPMQIDRPIYQPVNIVLNGVPAAFTTTGITQTINLSGSDNGVAGGSGINRFLMNDTAVEIGTGSQMTWETDYRTGADGARVMLDKIFQKINPSASGNKQFLMDRTTLNALSDEGGSGTTITAGQTDNVMTVTAVGSSVLKVGTVISGPGLPVGMPTEFIAGLLTGAGGTGTYTMSKRLDLGSQSLTAGNYQGAFEVQNAVLNCDGGAWLDGCQMVEWDLSIKQPVRYKQHLTLSYALGDAAHGIYVDCALCISANITTPGTGGGLVMLSVGSGAANWPIDTLAPNTAVLRAQPNVTRSVSPGFGQQYKATYGVDFTVLNCGTACWTSPGMQIDGDGQISPGPLRFVYGSSGVTISAPGLRTASAVITSGGSGYHVDEQLLEPLSGSMWQATSVDGSGGVTAMILLHPGYPTSCPGAATRFTDLAIGTGLKATLTCDTSNGIVLGAASDKLGFYGATAIVKPTGWAAMTGTPDIGTVYDTSTVTLPQLAGRVAAIQAALTAPGFVGP